MTPQDKRQMYVKMLATAQSLIDPDADIIANMANLSRLIYETFSFWWVGFYRVIDNQLVLGPYNGPLACTRIGFGKGVCGTSWKQEETIIVPDVEEFPGHIACSSKSRSEIVVPVFNNKGKVASVLDIDSEKLATFDEIDRVYLEKLAALLQQ